MHHPDILDERERLRSPLLGSLALHAAVLTAGLVSGYITNRAREIWGDPNSLGGGSVTITPVSKISLPSRAGRPNPVANDTESSTPPPPTKPEAAKRVEPDREAVDIKSRKAPRRQSEEAAAKQRYRPQREEQPNQLHSATGQALTSPMFATTGSGNVGVGAGNPFGNRFGAYAALLRELVGRKWRTNDVDSRLQTAPPVIVTFEIYRDGTVRNVRILQRSGNYALDMSAQRAIVEAAPLPPLPRDYERDVANIEFWFELKR
jgi:periplasmic protein TonB